MTTILFDYGGVVQELMDDDIGHSIAVALGISYETFTPHYRAAIPLMQVGALSENEFLGNLSQSLQIERPSNAEDLFTSPFRDSSRLYQEVVEFLEELNARKIKTAVLSNTIPSHARINRQRNNYRWFKEGTFLSCEIGLVKPDPGCFRFAAEQLNEDLTSLILVDDSGKNVRGAEDLKVRAIKHVSKEIGIDELRNRLKDAGLNL